MVRVLLVGLPALLEGIFRERLSREPSFVVESITGSHRPTGLSERLAEVVPPGAPSILVIREDTPHLPAHTLMAEHPHVCVMVLSADGRSAALYRRGGPPTLLQDSSMDDVVSALRTLAATFPSPDLHRSST